MTYLRARGQGRCETQTSLLCPPLHQNDNHEEARMTFRESHQHSQAGKHGVISNGVQTSMDHPGNTKPVGLFLAGEGMTQMHIQSEGISASKGDRLSQSEISLPSDGNKDFWTPHCHFTSQDSFPCSQEHLERSRVPLPACFPKTLPSFFSGQQICLLLSSQANRIEILRKETWIPNKHESTCWLFKDMPALEGFALWSSAGCDIK